MKKRICIGDLVMVLGIFELKVIGFSGMHYKCKRTDNGDIWFYAKAQLTLKEQGEDETRPRN
ncbi:MAG: hypothetical protein GY777_01315 [Candidatus Brocadiaceae bacterium]|nr:hypothetical protein [Candidatus Brocadiaceae bacterium]